MLGIVSAVTDTVLSHCAHIRFRTPTALGPQESYQTTKIYSPILLVKQRGDVIFHLGTVIILVVSGSLLWLVGRSRFCGECVPFPSLLLPLCLTLTIINEMAASFLMGASLQGDQLTQVLNKGTNYLRDTLRWAFRWTGRLSQRWG